MNRAALLAILNGTAARPAFGWDFTRIYSLPPGTTFTRASSATYRDNTGTRQTAASGVPRFDHSAAGVPLGLLIEEARTNYLLNSTAPVTQTTGSLPLGTYTVWCEGGTSVAVAGNTATITGAGSATPGVPKTFVVTVAGTVNVTVSGAVTAFQLENGYFPTSLIITAGATATRSADVCYVSTAGWLDPLGGTLVVDADIAGFASGVNNPSYGYFSDGTIANQYGWRALSTAANFQFIGYNASALQVATSAGGAITANVRRKAAFSFALNNSAFAVAGATVGTDTACTVPSTMSRLYLGVDSAGSAEWLNGHIASVAYYKPPRYSAALAQVSA